MPAIRGSDLDGMRDFDGIGRIGPECLLRQFTAGGGSDPCPEPARCGAERKQGHGGGNPGERRKPVSAGSFGLPQQILKPRRDRFFRNRIIERTQRRILPVPQRKGRAQRRVAFRMGTEFGLRSGPAVAEQDRGCVVTRSLVTHFRMSCLSSG